MATYTVIQDIEAEDKLLGPLSLRQFLYAVIALVLGFISFRLLTSLPPLAIPFIPPTILFFILAAPFGRDQPSEVWLLAKIRFLLKPRKRVWDQSGLQELVTITAPKKIERQLTDGLSQTEVKSRLQALANTIDTRGWAIKGVANNMATNPLYFNQSSDRLFDMNALMNTTNPDAEVPLENDPLAAYTPVAQQFTQMVAASDQAHRQQIMQRMDEIRTRQASQPASPVATPSAVPVANPVTPIPTATIPTQPAPSVVNDTLPPLPQPLVSSQRAAYGNTHVLQPQASAPTGSNAADNTVTAPRQTDKIKLANNNDLNVATIAREANKLDGPQDEVVISLR